MATKNLANVQAINVKMHMMIVTKIYDHLLYSIITIIAISIIFITTNILLSKNIFISMFCITIIYKDCLFLFMTIAFATIRYYSDRWISWGQSMIAS